MAVIDLSQLPAPDVVEVPDFEPLLAERKEAFIALCPIKEQDALRAGAGTHFKAVGGKHLPGLLLRQRINETAQAVRVAYALGSDLEQLGACYTVQRLTVTPADTDAVPHQHYKILSGYWVV